MRKTREIISDLLFLAGAACVTYAGFLCCQIVGFMLAGFFSLLTGWLIAKGGDAA